MFSEFQKCVYGKLSGIKIYFDNKTYLKFHSQIKKLEKWDILKKSELMPTFGRTGSPISKTIFLIDRTSRETAAYLFSKSSHYSFLETVNGRPTWNLCYC